MSPDEVLAKHSSARLTEWMGFYKVEAVKDDQAAASGRLMAQVRKEM